MHSSKAYERGNPVRHRDVRLVLRECIRIIVELNWFFIIPKHRIQEGRCKKENSEYALVLLQKKKKKERHASAPKPKGRKNTKQSHGKSYKRDESSRCLASD